MPHVRTLVLVALLMVAVGVSGTLVTLTFAVPGSTTPQEWTLDAAPVRRVEIDAPDADVDLFPTTHAEIRVTLTGRRTREQAEVTVYGDTLRIRVARARPIGIYRGSLDLSVALPAKVYDALQADLGNGDLKARDLHISEIRVRQGNGWSRLESLRAERIELETRNGDLELKHVEGLLAARTRNGTIVVTADALEHPMDLETANGDVRLQIGTAPANATLDLNTRNGSTSVFGARRGPSWYHVLGNGDPVIKLTTRNGNIVVTE